MKKLSVLFQTAAITASLLLSPLSSVLAATPADTVSQEKTEITFMVSGTGDYAQRYKESLEEKLLDDFPDIEITVEAYPDEQYYSTLNTKLSMGDGPDFFRIQSYWAGPNAVQKLAPADYLVPLDDLPVIQSTDKNNTDPFTYNGHIYSLDDGSMILCTYYNKSVFQKLGLSIPQNWQEFLDVCETLKQNGITPIVTGNKDSYTMQFCLYQIAASQVYAENPDFNAQLADGTTHFTDPGTWDKVLDQYLLLFKNNYVLEHSLTMGNSEAIERFTNGEAAMLFNANFTYPSLTTAMGEDEVGAFPLPANDVGQPVYTVISKGNGTAVYSGSKHIELCKQIFNKLYAPADASATEESSADNIWQIFLNLQEKGQYTNNCNQGWKGDVEWTLEDGLSQKIAGASISVNYITAQMQKAYENG